MFDINPRCILEEAGQEHHDLEEYNGDKPRWCPGCGDYAILTAVQKLCHEQQLAPEKMVFVSGIGCASQFPFYIGAYGFRGLHGRALPVAEGIKMCRPDLHVFVNAGDGDCYSIGAAHWIHALRYNMNMVMMVHDNQIMAYIQGPSKTQTSATTPIGFKSETSPEGAILEPFNPVLTALGVCNASFVAQAPDWIPNVLYGILKAALDHKGFSFIRILQRCPKYTSQIFDEAIADPKKVLVLTHANGIQLDKGMSRIFKNQQEHDPLDLAGARKIAARQDVFPVGIFYHNPKVPLYEELSKPRSAQTPQLIQETLEKEFDKFAITS